MRLALVARGLVVGVFVLSGCGSAGARIAPRAVDEAAAVFGGAGYTLELSADDVTRLAAAGNVSDDAIRDVAPLTDTQPVWRRSVEAARAVDQRTDGTIRSTVLGVACDALNGKIRSADQLYASLAGQLRDLSRSQLESLARSTVDLWQDLHDARSSDDPDERAAAVITCFTLQSVP